MFLACMIDDLNEFMRRKMKDEGVFTVVCYFLMLNAFMISRNKFW